LLRSGTPARMRGLGRVPANGYQNDTVGTLFPMARSQLDPNQGESGRRSAASP
jgi:hypothetical protein